MAIEIVEQLGGLFTARVSGKLKKSEMAEAEKPIIEVMKSGHKVRILVVATGFQGWDDAGDWGDVSFQMTYDEQIEKIAIVGEKKWEDLASAFVGKGLRPVDIKYFQPSQLATARAWIGYPAS